MACSRSEYDDKNLKKNAFSGRRLQLELDRLNNQKGQISKQYRHEKDQLKRQLAEGGEILKLKSLDPSDIRPLSSADMRKLSPRFARKLGSTQLQCPSALPHIATPPGNSKASQTSPGAKKENQRRFSLPPSIVLEECIEYDTGVDRKRSIGIDNITAAKLVQRRASASNALQRETQEITGKINDFFKKLNTTSDNVNTSECQDNKSDSLSEKSSTK